jgi:tetratricopeptide (TPR) repeat protein
VSAHAKEPDRPDERSIRAHLKKVLASATFGNRAERAKRFLNFIVEETLAGRQESLKEYKIGVDVFGRPPDYDPQIDPIVRLEAGRLRNRLNSYYRSEGSADSVQIGVPKGTYVPMFSWTTQWSPRQVADDAQDCTTALQVVESAARGQQVWNVPPRNPFFTARDAYLEALRDTLAGKPSAAILPQAISGLAGVGKTETAIEYAHRYRDHYTAGLWVVADSRDSLLSGFVSLAHLLDLPQRHERDVALVATAVRRWLESHTGWLLVFDNAEDLSVVRAFLPAGPGGHCLITTRLHATGSIAESRRLKRLELSEGALLLLKCAKVIAHDAPLQSASDADRSVAEQICEELGGLPLALDQAGAFIDETPSTLAEYLALYRLEGSKLRARRGNLRADTHQSVTTTFSLSFQQVAERNPAAAELVRACAFLEPDAIPEELFTQTTKHLSEELARLPDHSASFTEVLEVAGRFSLIRRDPVDRSIHIHRLVQEVIQDGMTDDARRVWIERLLEVLEQVFPSATEDEKWQQTDRLLPHARAVVRHARIYKVKMPGNRVRRKCSLHLMGRGQHAEAEPLLLEELAACEEDFGTEHTEAIRVLNALAVVYRGLHRHSEAKVVLARALSIADKIVGQDDSQLTPLLVHLAMTQEVVGLHAEAEALLLRARAIHQNRGEVENTRTAAVLCALARFYRQRNRHTEAEPLLLHALEIIEIQFGVDHLETTKVLFELALVYLDQGRYAEAERGLLRSLTIREKLLGPEHVDVIETLYQLVLSRRGQGRYAEAEADMERALRIAEKVYRPGRAALIALQRLAAAWSRQSK